METPLDVLSRAASLVETSDSNRESLYKNTSPLPSPIIRERASPCKELPSKLLKHERIKERQELSHTLNFDRDHAGRINSKKSAGTQTQFTSFNGDTYTNPPPYYPREAVAGESSSYPLPPPMYLPPPPLPSHPSHDHPANRNTEASSSSPPDFQNAPLNLSLSCATSSTLCHRPSVITCTNTSPVNSSSSHRYGCTPSPESTAEQPVTDPAIEEHFRRSLGQNYREPPSQNSMNKTTSSPTNTTGTSLQKISITGDGSVDDHFAKSLGDRTWTAIKAKVDPVSEIFTGSVDDHFAKALGDTWHRIKAEKENKCHSSTGSSPNGSPQHTSVVTT